MSSPDSDTIRILTDISLYLHRYVVTVFYAIGNLSNFITMFIFLKRSWRKNVCVFYFLICLIADTIFVNVTVLGSALTTGFHISPEISSVVWCKLFFYISYLFSLYLPIILILASVDRLLISSQNVDTRLYSSKRLAYFSISVSIVACLVYSLHVLIKVDIQEYYPSFYICYFDQSPFYRDFFTYSTVVQSVLVPLILIILSILAFKNVRRIRAVPRQQRREIRAMTKKDFQLLRCLYIHNILYVASSVLLTVVVVFSVITRSYRQTPLDVAIDNILNNFGSFLHYIPYGTSFFIFASVSKAFRVELKKLAGKLCHREVLVVPEEDNRPRAPTKDNNELARVVSTIDLHAEVNK